MHLNDNSADRAARERAYELAETGQYAGWREVREAMIGAGWPNAGEALSQEYSRLAVDDRCAAARVNA